MYRERKYSFGEQVLAYRTRLALTQSELADQLGVHRRSIQKWEVGESYPRAETLQRLIALLLDRSALTAGQERAEALALWAQAAEDGARPLAPFDEPWFAALLAERAPPGAAGPARLATNGTAQAHGAAVSRPADLPSPPTSFIGRGDELARLAALLGDPDCRLLTLLGPGGTGKTRLAIAAAAAQAGAFADGAAFVALAPLGAPGQIAPTIGAALGLSFLGQADPAAHLLDHLRGRHMLLVLDNFEHLLDGAGLVADILACAPRVTLLATSRERLNLLAEWLFDVEGLAFPADDPRAAGDLIGYSAVELFVQRARQVQPLLEPDAGALATIARICQHVAGMPLAIELAAVGLRTLPLATIEQQISSNLDALATTMRDVPARHRSMRAVFDHSWELLSAPEQALLSRLAVFRGGWTAEAAGRVAGAPPGALAALIDKSLVRQGRAEPAHGDAGRFSLLEPTREYALERLVARGELAALQLAHAGYYLALAEAAAAQWDTPTADSALEQLDREQDNVAAALQWACADGDPTLGLQLGVAITRYWRSRGQISAGRAWLAALLARSGHAADEGARAARLRALHSAAWLASDQHDFDHAAHLLEESRALGQTARTSDGDGELLINAALQARAAGQYARATALLEDALAWQRARGDRGGMSSAGTGLSLYTLASVLREQGQYARAAALYEEARQFHHEIGDQEGASIGLLGLGDVARDQGDVAGTRAHSTESMANLRQLGTQWAVGFALHNLAQAAYLAGDLAEASEHIHESVALFRRQRADGSLAEVLVTLGQVARAQGDTAAAQAALAEALRLAQMLGPRLLVPAALEGLAVLAAHTGQAERAVRLLSGAEALRQQMGTPLRPADRPAVAHALEGARAALGDHAFVTLWSAAAQLPLDQVIAGVMSGAPAS